MTGYQGLKGQKKFGALSVKNNTIEISKKKLKSNIFIDNTLQKYKFLETRIQISNFISYPIFLEKIFPCVKKSKTITYAPTWALLSNHLVAQTCWNTK